MNIGINLLYLYPKAVGGTETYARGLIESLRKTEKNNLYFLFCNKECAKTFKPYSNVVVITLPVTVINRIARVLFEILIFPFYLYKYKIDVVHSLGYSSPLITHCASVVNIYDLNWYFHPEDFSCFRRLGWKFSVYCSAYFCDKIITTSISSKKHIIKVLKVKPEKVEIVYGGIPSLKKPYEKKYLQKMGISGDFVFTLSADVPHKNILGLLKAFKILKSKNKNYQLVIGGLTGNMKNLAKEYIESNSLINIKIYGWLEDRLVSSFFKYCSLFVIPSLHEGFCFVAIEAFTTGAPVISSNAFSLREVVDSAGILVNPRNYADIAKNIILLMEDPKLRKEYSSKGKIRAQMFDWSISAKKTINIYKGLHQ